MRKPKNRKQSAPLVAILTSPHEEKALCKFSCLRFVRKSPPKENNNQYQGAITLYGVEGRSEQISYLYSITLGHYDDEFFLTINDNEAECHLIIPCPQMMRHGPNHFLDHKTQIDFVEFWHRAEEISIPFHDEEDHQWTY